MKILVKCLLLTIISSFSICNECKIFSSNFDGSFELGKSVFVVLESLARGIKTVYLSSSGSFKTFEARDFNNELLFKLFVSSKISAVQGLKSFEDTNAFGTQMSLTVFIVENSKEFLRSFKKNSLKNSKILIVVMTQYDEKSSKIQEIFDIFWSFQNFNINVMFRNQNGEICVQTFIPFNEKSCNDTTPILINKFSHGKFDNDINHFFPHKMKNLHNCQVRVSISNNSLPHIFTKDMNDSTHQFSGRDVNLMETLAQSLNFKINYSYFGEVGYIYENGTAKGTLDILKSGDADLSVSDWWLKEKRLKFFDVTNFYVHDQIVFIVPPGRDFTALEKLVYPFSTTLWIAVVVLYLVGIIVIFAVKRRDKNNQNFVFGAGVQNPYLNMFIALIGGAQKILPKRNFSRFLLSIFLLYSLIMRTLYQGAFFKLLKSNKRLEEVQTIEEIVERDYKLYVFPWTADLFQEAEATKNR